MLMSHRSCGQVASTFTSAFMSVGTPARSSAVCLLLCCLTAIVGCSVKPPGMPTVAPTSGVVTMDGQPLANVSIVFMTEKGGKVAFGGTDASGRYELRYSGKYMGGPVGTNIVRITTILDEPPPPNWKDPIPKKYNESSELRADVKAGPNTFNFDLTSKSK